MPQVRQFLLLYLIVLSRASSHIIWWSCEATAGIPQWDRWSTTVRLWNWISLGHLSGEDRDSVTLLLLFTLSMAFDTTDHAILLDQPSGLGIGSTMFKSGCSLASWHFCYGALKGNILSRVLFNIYMKLLGAITRCLGQGITSTLKGKISLVANQEHL